MTEYNLYKIRNEDNSEMRYVIQKSELPLTKEKVEKLFKEFKVGEVESLSRIEFESLLFSGTFSEEILEISRKENNFRYAFDASVIRMDDQMLHPRRIPSVSWGLM